MQISRQNITIDTLDEAIIAAFQEDGRRSNREVARRLKVSEGTVRLRLKRLQEQKAVCFDLITDIETEGMKFAAFLRLLVAPKSLQKVLNAAEKLDIVTYLTVATGKFNILGFIHARNQDEALTIINKRIHKLPGIVKMEVLPVVHQTKHAYLETWVNLDLEEDR